MLDPYEVLGASPDASPAELKRAYRRAAMRWHPDRNPSDPQAEARFKEVTAAWEQLSSGAGPSQRGPTDEDFIEDVASAVERAQDWFEHAVLPAYAQSWSRGVDSELATRLVADLERIADPSLPLPPIGRYGRRRARKLLMGLDILLDDYPAPNATELRMGRRLQLTIHPITLWNLGFRERDELDEAMLQLITARLVQVVALRRLPPQAGDWEATIALARERDDAVVASERRALIARIVLAVVAVALVLVPWMGG